MPEFGGIIALAKEWGPAGGIFALVVYFGFFQSRRNAAIAIRAQEQRADDALEREKYYREANARLEATVELQAVQLGQLLEQTKLTVALLQSIEIAARPSTPTVEGRHRKGG